MDHVQWKYFFSSPGGVMFLYHQLQEVVGVIGGHVKHRALTLETRVWIFSVISNRQQSTSSLR